ncbi:MAG: hypothetical protein AAF183_06615 [Pseudomonadota bacterium]
MTDPLTNGRTEVDAIIAAHLTDDDDPTFWAEAVTVLLSDLEAQIAEGRPRRPVTLRLGACSRWVRPHQTRWAAAGGFAWPAGYGGGPGSRRGLPQLDWSALFVWDEETETWHRLDRPLPRSHCCRAPLPTRTARHAQAAVQMIWEPVAPDGRTPRPVILYGLLKRRGRWRCVTSTDD